MLKENTTLLNESKIAINQCKILLQEISTNCCMPERSAKITDAFTKIDSILQNLELTYPNTKNIHNSIADIGDFGSMIGFLFATCCTEIREPLYQKMYRQMNSAHTKLWQYMGHSH